MPRAKSSACSAPTGPAFEGRHGAMFRYRTADPTAAIVALADSLRDSGAKLADLRLKQPSLEDVYLELIAGGRS